jgi:glycosyltransferase involved in cell wall biosynthesis
VLVGDGAPESVAALRRLAADLSIAERVSFLGPRDDVMPVLAASDIGVLMSHHEGFSNALLEYMAAALPVIATATGGNLDAIEEGRTGFLVPVGADAALGTALDRLIDDAPLRRRLGEAGRSRIENRFSLKSCFDAYEAAYREMFSGSNPTAAASSPHA